MTLTATLCLEPNADAGALLRAQLGAPTPEVDSLYLVRHSGETPRGPAVAGKCFGLATRQADAVERELIHRADYVSRHAIDARSRPARRLRCHEVSSCDGCHVDRGVSAARLDSVNPHPVGWLGSSSSPRFHGRRARRDIVSCAGCHERGPATNCIRCHRVGGHAANPHPSGWSSARSEDAGMCRYCHVP